MHHRLNRYGSLISIPFRQNRDPRLKTKIHTCSGSPDIVRRFFLPAFGLSESLFGSLTPSHSEKQLGIVCRLACLARPTE